MSPFSRLLTRYRERRDWGLGQLARTAQCDPSAVSRLESGERVPSRRLTLQLCAALALDPTDSDRLLIAAGYAPVWLVALAEVARVAPREVRRVS